jgi:hypothetical protein
MSKYIVWVNNTEISVEFSEDLTEEWMAEWRKYFYSFKNMQKHAEHIAWLSRQSWFRGLVEGYGLVAYQDGKHVLEIWDADGEVVSAATIECLYDGGYDVSSVQV